MMRKFITLIMAASLTIIGISNITACQKPKTVNNPLTKESYKPESDSNKWRQININNAKNLKNEFSKYNNEWYFMIWRLSPQKEWKINQFYYDKSYEIVTDDKIDVNNIVRLIVSPSYGAIWKKYLDSTLFYYITFDYKNLLKGLYYWVGEGEPQQPTIDVKTGEIIDWNF